jgi:tetratricopeptide (TPR) repeat protein
VDLDEVVRAMEAERFSDAIKLIERAMPEVPALMRLPLFGLLGEAYLQTGQAEQAVLPLEQAIGIADKLYDQETLLRALAVRHEVARYLGQHEAASRTATQIADLLDVEGGKGAEAHLYRTRARFVNGEPLLRVVAKVGDRLYEIDDAPLSRSDDAGIQFSLARNRPTLRPAARGLAEGEALAEAGRFQQALDRFVEGSHADPYDPHPRYLAALTLLYLKRSREALPLYDQVERLAPGWFHVRSDRALAEQLVAGTLSHDAWQAVAALEDAHLGALARLELAGKVLADHPRLAQLHLASGKALLELNRRDEAAGAFESGLHGDGDPDVRARLAFELGSLIGDPDLIQQATDPAGNLVAAAMARIVLRAQSQE